MGIHANNRDARLSRIYCDGVKAQKDGDLQNTNPWDTNTNGQEYEAWDTGWVDASGNAVDLSMCGYPAPGKPSPEVENLRY